MSSAIAAQFGALGVAVPAAAIDDEDEAAITVWDVNAEAVKVFWRSATQWRWTGLSTWSSARLVPLGLDYSAVEVVMRRLGIPDEDGGTFAAVQDLESFAREAFEERAH